MKTKLVSLNIGVRLIVQKDGKEEMSSYSQVCNFENKRQPLHALVSLFEWLNEELGTGLVIDWDGRASVDFAKPKIKAPAPTLTQSQFNERIKELVP